MWCNDSATPSTSGSVAQMVAEAANSFVTNELLPGFVYSPEYDMYYSAETGYYYDMKTSLYYHPYTQCYYQYNETTGEYHVLSAKQKVKWKKKEKRTAIKVFGDEYVNAMTQEEADICTLLMEVINSVVFLAGEGTAVTFASKNNVADAELSSYMSSNVNNDVVSEESIPESDDDEWEAEQRRRLEEEEMCRHPPCVRLIEMTKLNMLHIITITGSTIGCGHLCDVKLGVVDSVAEEHARISFVSVNGEPGYYQLECLKKRHPVYINDEKFTTKHIAKLKHECKITIGPNAFIAHIHNGTNTCADCEPGVLNARQQEKTLAAQRISKLERKTNHRQEMKQMKAKLGLFEEAPAEKMGRYRDRAVERRAVVGSEPAISSSNNIYRNCRATPKEGAAFSESTSSKPSSATISDGNKGFKLLKSMGWNEGKGLGKQNQGIAQPIESQLKTDRRGLGAQNIPRIPIKFKLKAEVLEKTRQRYDRIEK